MIISAAALRGTIYCKLYRFEIVKILLYDLLIALSNYLRRVPEGAAAECTKYNNILALADGDIKYSLCSFLVQLPEVFVRNTDIVLSGIQIRCGAGYNIHIIPFVFRQNFWKCRVRLEYGYSRREYTIIIIERIHSP